MYNRVFMSQSVEMWTARSFATMLFANHHLPSSAWRERMEFEKAATLVVRRWLKALDTGKEIPMNVTASQKSKGVTQEDIEVFAEQFFEELGEHAQKYYADAQVVMDMLGVDAAAV